MTIKGRANARVYGIYSWYSGWIDGWIWHYSGKLMVTIRRDIK